MGSIGFLSDHSKKGLWLLGTDVRDLPIAVAPKDKSTRITYKIQRFLELAVPISVSLGPVMLHLALCFHLTSVANTITSLKQRVGREFPERNPFSYKKFIAFVQEWIKLNVVPLDPDIDVSFETWIAQTDYTEWRKDQLRRTYAALQIDNPKFLDKIHDIVKGFTKNESFGENKTSRNICSRSDPAKCIIGPWAHLFDKDLFKRRQFIKTVPIDERPAYILDLLGPRGPYHLTDYSAFESLYTPHMLKNVELAYMTKLFSRVEKGTEFMAMMTRMIATTNKVVFKDVTAMLKGRRMSGEMTTSSGNGFTNAMIIEYTAHSLGGTVDYVCEGDDGAAKYHGCNPVSSDIECLGIRVKLETTDDICRASFCGNVFDPVDMTNVTNPLIFLAKFGWSSKRHLHTSTKTKMALLRAKGLSSAYQYAGCPVIQAFSDRVLNLTRSYDVRKVADSGSLWERRKLAEAMERRKFKEVGYRTRCLVAEMYNISVEDQLRLEEFFNTANLLQPYELPGTVQLDIPSHWNSNWIKYVTDTPTPQLIPHIHNHDWSEGCRGS